MKDVMMMMLPDCPYCRQADRLLAELAAEDARYGAVPIRRVDESVETTLADSLDYYGQVLIKLSISSKSTLLKLPHFLELSSVQPFPFDILATSSCSFCDNSNICGAVFSATIRSASARSAAAL